MSKKKQNQFYTLDNILTKNADYNIIFGERSNGKTYAALKYGLGKYIKDGEAMAYLRRWQEDTRGKRAETVFNGLIKNGEVEAMTNGEYTTIVYSAGKWYLANYDNKLRKFIPAPEPFCYAFSLSDVEHDKSLSFPDITTIVFDEFLTRRFYLPDEFVIFMNVLSTIIRNRDNVKIFMLGNTVNKYCPYFAEFGLTHVTDMPQGKIDVYNYGDSHLTVAVEYCGNVVHKPSDKYFAFNNPKLHMITGGKWELSLYPHLPVGTKILPKQIVFSYFILFDGKTLQGDIVDTGRELYTFIHAKTTPIQDEHKDLIYCLDDNPQPNYRRSLMDTGGICRRVAWFYANNKVFYQSNDIGELIRNYIVQSSKTYLV